jgi:nucleoside-diphosphate-sugar epimerase
MKILVTGYKGFIGSRIYKELLENKVLYYDDVPFELDGLEINDPFPKKRYDRIYHFGGKTLLRESLSDPMDYFNQNVNFTANLLEKARKDDSAVVFPTSGSAGLSDNPYSKSKYLAEQWVDMYGKIYGLKGKIYRLYNVYGGKKGAIYNFLKAALNNEPINVYNEGTSIRDYVHVDKVVSFIMSFVKDTRMMKIDLGTGIPTSTNELVHIIEDVINYKFKINYSDLSVQEPKYSVSPQHTVYSNLRDGIKRVWEELKCVN